MIIEMKKLVLLAHRSLRHKILSALHRNKMTEIIATEEIGGTSRLDNAVSVEKINENLQRITFALDYFKAQKKNAEKYVKLTEKTENPYIYAPIKEKPFSSIARMSFDEFDDISNREVELLANIGDLEDISSKQNELSARVTKLKAEIENLRIYENIEIPFSELTDTAHTAVFSGYVPVQRRAELEALASEFDDVVVQAFDDPKFAPFVAICLKENAQELSARLQSLEFTKNNIDKSASAKQLIAEAENEISDILSKDVDLMTRALFKEPLIRDFKTLYDYYLIEKQKFSALDGVAATERSFVLEAWYPAEAEDRLKAVLDGISDALIYEFREPEKDEAVPTLVRNSKLISPYQNVTDMYSVPDYRQDMDPNPVMAFFYFLFFGMMVADAAYGLLLAIGGFLLYKFSKPVPGKGKLILIIAFGGISTALWGIFFGSWFGLNFPDEWEIWRFNPLEGSGPLILLGISLGLGIVHMLVGMIINAVNLVRKKRPLDALCEVGTWFMIFAGIAILVVSLMFLKIDALTYAGAAVAGAGALLLVLSGIRGKKGAKKVLGFFGGFGKLYDGVNYISDVLSYARLFGLGLSGTVVALVVNQICQVVITMIGIPAIGYIICIPIFAVGHLFNIAISTLGAYVHNCRLQYIEFFGKFYNGGGHAFVPFGSQIKYTYLDK